MAQPFTITDGRIAPATSGTGVVNFGAVSTPSNTIVYALIVAAVIVAVVVVKKVR